MRMATHERYVVTRAAPRRLKDLCRHIGQRQAAGGGGRFVTCSTTVRAVGGSNPLIGPSRPETRFPNYGAFLLAGRNLLPADCQRVAIVRVAARGRENRSDLRCGQFEVVRPHNPLIPRDASHSSHKGERAFRGGCPEAANAWATAVGRAGRTGPPRPSAGTTTCERQFEGDFRLPDFREPRAGDGL